MKTIWTKALVKERLEEVGVYSTKEAWRNAKQKPSVEVILYFFSRWEDAWKAANVPRVKKKKYEDDELLSMLKAVGQYLSVKEWDARYWPKSTTYRMRFGTWRNAWLQVGIDPITGDAELLE